jgi:predicted DCC family thiol-disulfide oxidoreductase YuxK
VNSANHPSGTTIVFYDGVCGLCNRLNQFLLPRDRHARIRFAPLQSQTAGQTLARYGQDASDLDTVYVLAGWKTADERLLARSQAILHTLSLLGGGWAALARVGSIIPVSVADPIYRLVARNRYRIFGKFETCKLPPPEWRERFLDP